MTADAGNPKNITPGPTKVKKRSGLANSLERALRKSIAFPLSFLGESIDSYYAGAGKQLPY